MCPSRYLLFILPVPILFTVRTDQVRGTRMTITARCCRMELGGFCRARQRRCRIRLSDREVVGPGHSVFRTFSALVPPSDVAEPL